MEKKTIETGRINTIYWLGDTIVDWAGGGYLYSMDGKRKQIGHDSFSFDFDACIMSANGVYAFIYIKLGTKGLLLRNGELIREINRSYYFAASYEYPAAFVSLNDTTYLVHCPAEYNRLEFEDVETGEIITNDTSRNPSDVFHSRLEVSPGSKFLMSKGWLWHPLDTVNVYNIEDCINDPCLLDIDSKIYSLVGTEVCTASFVNDVEILIGSSEEIVDDENINLPPKHITVWNIETNTLSEPLKVNGEFGNLIYIGNDLAWDTYINPKILNIKTGEIIAIDETVDSGKQRSSITSNAELIQIVFNSNTKQLAIKGKEKIEILTP